MTTGLIIDPHIIYAILAIAVAMPILIGLICLNSSEPNRQGRRGR